MPIADAAGSLVMWGELRSEYTYEYEDRKYDYGQSGIASREPPRGHDLSEYGRIISNPPEVSFYLGHLHIGNPLRVPDPRIYDRVRDIRN